MNEVIQNIRSRRSVKKYKSDAVPQEIVDAITEAGTFAPSGLNKQSPIILQVTNKAVRDKLSRLNAQVAGMPSGTDPFYNAPVVLAVLANKDVPTYVYDGSLVMENLLLAAHSLGIGACWIHRAKETFQTEEGKALLKELGIEGNYEGIGNCILGYADAEPIFRPRKDGYIFKIN